MIRRTLALTLVVTIFWTTTWATAPGFAQEAPPTQITYEEAKDRLNLFLELTEELRSHIDHSQFDLEALLEKLDFDSDNIIRFVKEEIYFEQYPGLLRGAQGTLMSRAGNSLDQSVLLATLLKDSGYDARLLHGKLNAGDAERLLGEMGRPRDPQPRLGNLDAMRPVLRKLMGLSGAVDEADDFLDQLLQEIRFEETGPYADAQADAKFLISAMNTVGPVFKSRDLTRQLTEEARDYYWVEFREEPGQPWLRAHPAYEMAWPGDAEPQALDTIADSVPEDLLHRLRVEVQIDVTMGDSHKSIPVMEPWERPVANLVGTTLSFSNFPSGATELAHYADTAELARTTSFFIPMFNGTQAVGAQVFDRDGVTIGAEDLAMGGGATELFQELGSKTESAANALSGLGSTKKGTDEVVDLRALDRQWIRYTLVAPGDTRREWTREIFNKEIGGGDDVSAFAQLITHHGFMVQPGTLPPAYLLDLQASGLLAKREFLEWYLSKRFSRSIDDPTSEMFASLADSPEIRYFDVFDSFPGTAPDERIYRAEPSLLVIRQGPSPENPTKAILAELDLVNNRHRSLRFDGSRFHSAPEAAVLRGSWETRMEEVGFSNRGAELTRQLSTRSVMQTARQDGIGIRVLQSSESASLQSMGLSSSTHEAVQRDLDAGFWVLLPERVLADGSMAWWRANPNTGETLGRGGDGRGINASAYTTVLILISIGGAVIFGAGSFVACLQNSPCGVDDCLATAGVGALLGFAFSYAIGWILIAAAPSSIGLGGGVVWAEAEIVKVIAGMVMAGDMVIGAVSLAVLPACLQ